LFLKLYFSAQAPNFPLRIDKDLIEIFPFKHFEFDNKIRMMEAAFQEVARMYTMCRMSLLP